ncbi:MAG: recombinase family protein [Blastocatellia bacterium]|nr:recombinase family protein [Blastocatellia bacterium]
MPDALKLAFSYLRISSQRQLDGDGVRRQLERTERYCREKGLTLDEKLQDLGISAFTGANRNRGALGQFMKRVENGEIPRGSHLVVESLDRLSRNKVTKALKIFMEIIEAGITLHTLIDKMEFTEDSIDKNPSELIVSISMMARANEESSTKSDRLRETWDNKRSKARSGAKLTARVPGWIEVKRDENGAIVDFGLDKVRAGWVEQAYKWYADGAGTDIIARRLNDAAVECWGAGRGKGRDWSGGAVHKIMFSTPAVIGHFQPHKMVADEIDGVRKMKRVPVGDLITDYYPRAITDDELWLRAKDQMDRKKRDLPSNSGGRKGTVYGNLFSKLARCISCGRPMVIRDRGRRSTVVLRCSGNRNGTCNNFARPAYKPLEESVLKWVSQLDLVEPEASSTEALDANIASLQVKLGVITKGIANLLKEIEAGTSVGVLLRQRESEQATIQAAIAKLEMERQAIGLRPTARDRTAELAQLQESLNQEGADRFMIRARIASSLREIVSKMACGVSGQVFMTLRDGSVYVFNEAARGVGPTSYFENIHMQPFGASGQARLNLPSFIQKLQAEAESAGLLDVYEQVMKEIGQS